LYALWHNLYVPNFIAFIQKKDFPTNKKAYCIKKTMIEAMKWKHVISLLEQI